jgi:biotin-dependent carboxylase-like uncharacterized protein
MTAALRIRAAGPGVTVQDAGRRGLLRFGVTPAGPMDEGAFAAATLAAGAPTGAAIEVSLGGVELEAVGAAIGLALAGGVFDARLDGRPLPSACVLPLAPGAKLSLRAGTSGAWHYVAVFGRIDLAPALGSLATHVRSGLGGLHGRSLRAGDVLPIADLRKAPAEPMALGAPWLARETAPLRVLLGPQDDFFTRSAIDALLCANWRLSPRSDRMAYRLDGPRLEHAKGHDIVSDGVAFGAIQVPGDGAPLVLMADRQPTGGYPKIAHVIGADLGALAQTRPGETLRFRQVSWDEAVAARRLRREAIAAGPRLARGKLSSDALLSANLIGGAVSATDEPETN